MSVRDRLRWWVDLWRRREAPHSMALVRIALATVLLVDLLQMRWLGLVRPLMGARAAGGMGAAERLERADGWRIQASHVWSSCGEMCDESFAFFSSPSPFLPKSVLTLGPRRWL